MLVSCNNPKPAEGEASEEINVEKTVKASSLKPGKAEVDSVSYLLGVNFGSFLKGYNFGGDLNYSLIRRGIKDFLGAKGNPQDPEFVENFKINPEEMNRLFNEFLEKRHEYTLAKNLEDEKLFLEKNLRNKDVQVTESGLQYIIYDEGSENKPGPKDTVYVTYKGTLPDGTVFDQTAEDPIHFPLTGVIKGWTEGLQLIGEGGHIQLVIPSSLAYQERGQRGIEPNTPLTFDITMTEVRHFVEKEEE